MTKSIHVRIVIFANGATIANVESAGRHARIPAKRKSLLSRLVLKTD